MNRYAITTTVTALFILLLGLVFVTACSDEDLVTPILLPEPEPLAVSPDSLMSMWQTALTTMDSTMYEAMYDPEFRFRFGVGDVSDFGLMTDFMTREETVQAGWGMFSGENFTNWEGEVAHSVARITFPQMTQETPWSVVSEVGGDPMHRARFSIQMHVERGHGIITIMAAGSYEFYAMAQDTILSNGNSGEYYRMIAMETVNHGKTPGLINTWGGVNLTYMTNEAPVAVLQISDLGGSPLPVMQCDATGSHDQDSGLAVTAYRWQFESGGEWTPWTNDPVTVHGYTSAGDFTITVEVRDRWGAVSTAAEQVQAQWGQLPFPGTPDQVMQNFQTAYETRNIGAYQEILHRDFLMILQDQTITEFPDVGTTLDVSEEIRIHQRMFSGLAVTDPEGDLVPGVKAIYFSTFRALDSWVMSPSEDIIPNAEWAPFEVDIMFDRGQTFSTMKVEGTVKFYVTSRDSLHEGNIKQYYQMAGMVDLTGAFKASEVVSWGSVKALFR